MQMQNFLRQGSAAPCHPQNRICINFDRKGTEIVHLWFPQIHILLRKEGAAPLQPPEIIHFCKFRPKRALWLFSLQNTEFS